MSSYTGSLTHTLYKTGIDFLFLWIGCRCIWWYIQIYPLINCRCRNLRISTGSEGDCLSISRSKSSVSLSRRSFAQWEPVTDWVSCSPNPSWWGFKSLPSSGLMVLTGDSAQLILTVLFSSASSKREVSKPWSSPYTNSNPGLILTYRRPWAAIFFTTAKLYLVPGPSSLMEILFCLLSQTRTRLIQSMETWVKVKNPIQPTRRPTVWPPFILLTFKMRRWCVGGASVVRRWCVGGASVTLFGSSLCKSMLNLPFLLWRLLRKTFTHD